MYCSSQFYLRNKLFPAYGIRVIESDSFEKIETMHLIKDSLLQKPHFTGHSSGMVGPPVVIVNSVEGSH